MKSQQEQLTCSYCNRRYHTESECKLRIANEKKSSDKPSKNKRRRTSKESDSESEYSAPFIESEALNALYNSDEVNEQAYAYGDKEPNASTHFIFDSGATTHVTPNKNLVYDIKAVPEVQMTSALSNAVSTIRKRGTVRLNDKWVLRDVAFTPRASSNLISEGRLADAGYTITKTKTEVLVLNEKGRVILRGRRWNRLWIYTINGHQSVPPNRPINTLQHKPKDKPRSNEEEKKEEPAATAPKRRIPNKRRLSQISQPQAAES